MDLGSVSAILESIGDNEASPRTASGGNDTKAFDTDTIVVGAPIPANSRNVTSEPAGPTMSATKGYGLKKWRRVARDSLKVSDTNVDSGKVLKRGLSISVNTNGPARGFIEENDICEGSSGSSNVPATDHVGFHHSSSPLHNLSPGVAILSGFAAETDSEQSEDRDSKSSTAASAPKFKFDRVGSSFHTFSKNKTKNWCRKTADKLNQNDQRALGISKKARGRAKIEKDDSRSSMESDSRSSIFFPLKEDPSTKEHQSSSICNGKQNGDSLEHDEVTANCQNFSSGNQDAHGKNNFIQNEDTSKDDSAAYFSWNAKLEGMEYMKAKDPLVQSVTALQGVREVFEKEIMKFQEIGNTWSSGTYPKSHNEDASYSNISLLDLTGRVKDLKSTMEKARTEWIVKDSQLSELEDEKESKWDKCREMQREVERLLRKMLETEVEYLTVAAHEKQYSLDDEVVDSVSRVKESKHEDEVPKEEHERSRADGDFKTRRRLWNASMWFLMQSILLVSVLFYLVRRQHPPATVAPT